MAKTLFQKVWDAHTVRKLPNGQTQLLIGTHLIHEVTSPQAFGMLRDLGLKVRFPHRTFATVDHIVPTNELKEPYSDTLAQEMIDALRRNTKESGVRLFDTTSGLQGIVHMVGPEQGITQPGMTIACGDSHTATHGAFGAEDLAHGRPARGAAADVFADQGLLGARTAAAVFPAVVEEPGVGRIGPILADHLHRLRADLAERRMQLADRLRAERTGLGLRMKARAPQHLVGHPIADAGETFLHQQHGLDRRARAATQEDLDDPDGELRRKDGGRDLLPPRRDARALPELDAAELPRVDEDEFLAAGHRQLEMVVRRRLTIGLAGLEPAGHPEVHADPGLAGKSERHLLRRGEGLQELRARERPGQRLRVDAPADAGLRVEEDLRDLPADARLPASAEIFDFGEFGHAERKMPPATRGASRGA